jgi:hypothetical protein
MTNQLVLSDELDPQRSWAETLVEMLGGTLRKVQYPDGETWFVVADYMYCVMGSKAKSKLMPWKNFKQTPSFKSLKVVLNLNLLWIDTEGGPQQAECLTAADLYRLTMSMSSDYPAVAAVKERLLRLTTFAEWCLRNPELAAETLLTISTQRQAERDAVGRTGYITAGRSATWANARVEAKRSHEKVTKSLTAHHVTASPDYGRVFGAQNDALLGQTKAEIVRVSGLSPAQARSFRDYLGEYAQKAIREANDLATRRMAALNRPLTDDEQTELVIKCAQMAAVAFRSLAEFAGVDFTTGVSTAEAQIIAPRPRRLLGVGK